MAKSIYALLDDLMTETSVPAVTDKDGKNVREYHGMVRHTFPRSALPTSAQFEDAEELLTWAEDAGVLHACLQSGVQSRIIDYRAIFKGMKKTMSGHLNLGRKMLTLPNGKSYHDLKQRSTFPKRRPRPQNRPMSRWRKL